MGSGARAGPGRAVEGSRFAPGAAGLSRAARAPRAALMSLIAKKKPENCALPGSVPAEFVGSSASLREGADLLFPGEGGSCKEGLGRRGRRQDVPPPGPSDGSGGCCSPSRVFPASVLDLIRCLDSWSPRTSKGVRTPWNCPVFNDLSCPQSRAAKNGDLIRRAVRKCHIIIYEVFNNHSTIIADSGQKVQTQFLNCTFEFGHWQGKRQNKLFHPPPSLFWWVGGRQCPCCVGSAAHPHLSSDAPAAGATDGHVWSLLRSLPCAQHSGWERDNIHSDPGSSSVSVRSSANSRGQKSTSEVRSKDKGHGCDLQ